jgi:hypothetical protein
VAFQPSAVAFMVHPVLTGQVEKTHRHIVIYSEIETIAVVELPLVGRREVKQAMPKERTDWRADEPCPFRVNAAIRGVCRFSLEGETTWPRSGSCWI